MSFNVQKPCSSLVPQQAAVMVHWWTTFLSFSCVTRCSLSSLPTIGWHLLANIFTLAIIVEQQKSVMWIQSIIHWYPSILCWTHTAYGTHTNMHPHS